MKKFSVIECALSLRAQAKQSLTALVIALLLPLNAYSAGGTDVYFERPDQMPVSGNACQGTMSPFKGNIVMGQVNGSTRTLWIKDVGNRRTNTVSISPAGGKFVIEVSDTGPTGYINLAYIKPLSGSSQRPQFSSNSGASFIQLNPSGVAPYTVFQTGSFSGGGGVNASGMKFGPDGNLYVFYFTKHTSLNEYNFNLQIYDKDGNAFSGPHVLSGAAPLQPTSLPFGLNDTGASISTAVTDTSVIAVAQPGHWWDPSCGSGCYREDTIVAYVWNIASQSLSQVVGIGHALPSSDYSNSIRPYGLSIGNSASLITSDGNSIYYLNGIADEWDAGRGMFEPAMEVRRFPPLGGGKYFPENAGASPIPYTDLTQIPAALNTSQFMDKNAGGLGGAILHFTAARYKSNFSNKVDIAFSPGVDAEDGLVDEFKKVRVTPAQDFSSQGGTVDLIQDFTNTTAQQVTPQGYVGDAVGQSSISSVLGGTVAMYCYDAGVGATGKYFHACDFS